MDTIPLDLIQKIMLLSKKQLYTSIRRTILQNKFFSVPHFSFPAFPTQPKLQQYHTDKSDENRKPDKQDDESDDDDDHKQLKKLGWKEKFKYIFKKYGKLAIVAHFGVYFATLLLTFLSLNYIPVMRSYAGKFIDLVNKYLHLSISNTATGGSSTKANLALTYVMVKFTEPIRLVVTIYITRALYRLSRRK